MSQFDLPQNQLPVVQTYQKSGLAIMQNINCFIDTFNKKFQDFENRVAQLGDTVTFQLPSRYYASRSLIANFQGTANRSLNLTVKYPASVAFAFNAEQFIFQATDYMTDYGAAAVAELGATVEADVAGLCETIPYRFAGTPSLGLQSFEQISNMLVQFRNYGSVGGSTKVYLTDTCVPQIVTSGLSNFTPIRNNEMAYSYEVGAYDRATFYRSSNLPVHYAGTIGNLAEQMTVVSVQTNANTGAVNAITFQTTFGADSEAVKKYDRITFAATPRLRFLQFVGHKVSNNAVQLLAIEDAATNSTGKVTIKITPELQIAAGAEQNINMAIVAGQKADILADHKVGMVVGGDAAYLAMPRMPSTSPFASATASDPATGASFRQYYGTVPFQNMYGMAYDCIYGFQAVPEYCMALIFPLSQ